MGIEIERKFLLKNAEWRKLIDSVVEIKQGYLNSHVDRTVRIRITGDQAFLTVKGKNKGSIRKEFEYEIPKTEGLSQLELCEQPIIAKKRYLELISKLKNELKELKNSELEVQKDEPYRSAMGTLSSRI